MRIFTTAVLGVFLAVSSVSAQGLSRVYTRPSVPPAEVLDRLNLKLDWRVYVPKEGVRDGFFSIQLLDGQVLVQTRSAGIAMLDATTGATLWRARVGTPYRVNQPLGYNAETVFAVDGDRLYALGRTTGRLQWQMKLPSSASAPPVADDAHVYLCLGPGKIYTYQLPDLGRAAQATADKKAMAESVPPPKPAAESTYRSGGGSLSSFGPLTATRKIELEEETGPRGLLIWEYPVGAGRLEQAPLLTDEFLTLAGTDGTFFTTSKFLNQILYSFKTEAPVSAGLGQYGETAYIVSQDFNVYALNIVTGRILWRVLGGAPILRKPTVFDEDLYFSSESVGLYRLDRVTGQLLWHNRQADQFLAQNKKFVYATDFNGRLLILDRVRGTVLTSYDGTRDFTVPIANELTDRIYLASQDGLLMCLHDRDYPTPLRTRGTVEKKPEGKPVEKPKEGAEKKPAPKEKDKDADEKDK